MSASSCTAGEQAFAGGYVLLGTLFTISIIHESTKLVHRYNNSESAPYKLSKTPFKLFLISIIFIILCIIGLIKCILYGLIHCDYILLSSSFKSIVFETIFTDLYAIQLYFLWIVLLIRLYFTFKNTPYQLSSLVIRIYSAIFVALPLLFILIIIPDLYALMIVFSFSLSIFITLSIIIVYCFKLFQVYRYHSSYKLTKDYQQYILQNDIDLLTIVTKSTVLTLISTLFSFLILLILIFIFVFTVYEIEIRYQTMILDLCLLLDTYITAICVILQFKYLHSKYQFCCNCIDVICRYYCNKYLNNDPTIPTPQGIIEMQQQTSISLMPPRKHKFNNSQIKNHSIPAMRVRSDTEMESSGHSTELYISSDEDILNPSPNHQPHHNDSARNSINNALSDKQNQQHINTRNNAKPHHQKSMSDELQIMHNLKITLNWTILRFGVIVNLKKWRNNG